MWELPDDSRQRLLLIVTFVNTLGSGLYLTAGAIFFIRIVGLPVRLVGPGLALAGITAMAGGPLLGQLADRLGPGRVYVGTLALEGTATGAFVLCRSFPSFLAVAILATIGDQGSRASRGALVARVGVAERVKLRALVRSVSNLGVALGAFVAGFALYVGTRDAYYAVMLGDAVSFFAAALLVTRFGSGGARTRATGDARWVALSDRPFLTMSALQGVASLQYQVPVVLLPLWLAADTKVPLWVLSPLYVLKTTVVVLFQVRVSRAVSGVLHAAVLSRRAGWLFAASSVAFASVPALTVRTAVIVLVAGMAVLAVGELLSAAAQFELSYGLATDASIGQYQGVFGMITGGALTVAPALLTLLCLEGRVPGWCVLAAAFVVSGVATVPVTRWAERTRTMTGHEVVRPLRMKTSILTPTKAATIGRDSMTERLVVISADGHAGPPVERFSEYFDPRYRADFDQYLVDRVANRLVTAKRAKPRDEVDALRENLRSVGISTEVVDRYLANDAIRDGYLGLADPRHRIAALEADGVVADVLFPDGNLDNEAPFAAGLGNGRKGGSRYGAPGPLSTGVGGERYPLDLVAAGCTAYNRWLASFCADYPDRFAGVALIAAEDIDGAVAEVVRAKQAGLRGGVLLPPLLLTESVGYNDPRYERLWATCADLEMPVNIHSGGGQPSYGPGSEAFALRMTELYFFSQRPLWFLLWGGVFERYPTLKVVFTEQMAYWVPQKLMELDLVYQSGYFAKMRENLLLKPSEYWARQCYVGATFMSREEAELRDSIGVRNLMWGSDFPHVEGTWPFSRESLRNTFGGLPQEDIRRMLSANAAGLYGFDLARLQKVADQAGPELTDLAQRESTAPDGYAGMAFR
jgi:predicted TIM-barrel fold metal-dependent hydrolase/MFS family permease